MELPGYDHALVIPARKERPDALRAVWQCLDARVCETSLVVLVINAARDDEKETLDLLAQLRDPRNLIATRDNLTALHAGAGRPDILLVDRCSAGRTVPGRQGVGLARKIGADIALELIVREKVASRLIYTTDADVQLPGEYFEAGRGNSGVAAILYPFGHDAGTGTKLPACLYETAMLYYVAGLKWAGSPYAFTTVGSTIAVDADHYAMVRGMPKRSAGEDFYLLNKLAKTGHIRQLADPIISIGARDSDRVPFGTGAALAKIAALDDPAQDFRFYDPRIFEQLVRLAGDAQSIVAGRRSRRVSGRLAASGELVRILRLSIAGGRTRPFPPELHTVFARVVRRFQNAQIRPPSARSLFSFGTLR